MQEEFSESFTPAKPPVLKQISNELKELFTYQNKIDINERYFGK